MRKGKTVSFGGRPQSAKLPATVDDWVSDREASSREATKRLTIDVPVSLHRRVKSQCALKNLVMADVMRELLERRFPATSDGKAGES
jgi:hypothetical protein